MLYTGKGDKGQTKLYHCDQKLSKSSLIAEALGALDEINSLLGWCKTKIESSYIVVAKQNLPTILEETQNSLFSVQAELAGAPKKLSKTAITKIEALIKVIDKELPPIKSFIIPGGTELSAMLDVARTVARGAERQVVAVAEIGDIKLQSTTLAYLNRLSSLLYALARLVNHRAGIVERKPEYK
ncbi:MAG: cob(I)yrinic acid a,c-diamide adenosyltransferase [Candidatus Paceibacterota bacterium]|jgi:cob(I)alamin adenosyltransferase